MKQRNRYARLQRIEVSAPHNHVILHVMPGQTCATVREAYEGKHGRIPSNCDLTFILHTMWSRI